MASLGATFAVGFATTALLTRRLGPLAFGLLMLVRSIVGNAGILESLFGAGITRYVAFHHAREEFATRDSFVGTGLVVNLLQGGCVSIIAVAVGFLAFGDIFGSVPAGMVGEAQWLLLAFFVVFLLQLCSLALSRALEGLQAYPQIRLTDGAVQLVTLGALFVYFERLSDWPLHRLALVYFGAELLRLGLFAAWAHALGLRLFADARVEWRVFKTLFTFGKPLAIAKLFTMLSYRGDAILLGIFATVMAVADYQVANQIWSAAVGGLAALTVALFPAVAQRAATGSAGFRTVFVKASRITLAVALCVATLAVYAKDFVIVRWVGPQYAGASLLTLLFMIQIVVAYHQGVSGQLVLGIDKHQPVGRYEAIGAAVNLVVSLALIRRYGAAGLLAGAIVKSLIVMPLYTRLALRAVGMSAAAYLRETVWPVWRFFGAALIAVMTIRAATPWPMATTAGFLAEMALLSGTMGVLLWVMVLSADDRRQLLRTVAS